MKKLVGILAAALLVLSIPIAASVSFVSAGDSSETIFESEGMAGVQAPFLRPTEIRGVSGPGAPWILDEGEVRIDADGRLRVEVEGLVLDPATVPAPVGGTNPVPFFRAIVSCLDGVDASGTPTWTNVVTETFPADVEGDAEIDTMISLPDPCFGIIVFVTSPGESWFAVTGFMF